MILLEYPLKILGGNGLKVLRDRDLFIYSGEGENHMKQQFCAHFYKVL